MNIENITDIIVLFLGICLVLFLTGVLLIKFITRVYMPFIDERDFILMEIARNRGSIRIHWEHELRRLYISQIPFIGAYLVKQSKEKSREKRKKFSS